MEIRIELLKPSELKQFYPVFTHILSTEFPCYTPENVVYLLKEVYTPFNFEYWIREDAKYCIVAREKGKKDILGFALVDGPYGGVSLCRWLGVLRQHQKQGIGRLLIARWEELARAGKCHKMEVAAQPTAKEFYEKAGLELEGFRKKSYFGADQYVFGKIL